MKHCPECNVEWEEKESITERFKVRYAREGIPSYLKADGFDTVESAATHTAEAYGCTPEHPRHFGVNHVGIQTRDYDGVSYWKCLICDSTFDRFTMKKVEE